MNNLNKTINIKDYLEGVVQDNSFSSSFIYLWKFCSIFAHHKQNIAVHSIILTLPPQILEMYSNGFLYQWIWICLLSNFCFFWRIQDHFNFVRILTTRNKSTYVESFDKCNFHLHCSKFWFHIMCSIISKTLHHFKHVQQMWQNIFYQMH